MIDLDHVNKLHRDYISIKAVPRARATGLTIYKGYLVFDSQTTLGQDPACILSSSSSKSSTREVVSNLGNCGVLDSNLVSIKLSETMYLRNPLLGTGTELIVSNEIYLKLNYKDYGKRWWVLLPPNP